MSQINVVRILTLRLFKIYFNIILQSLPRSEAFVLSHIPVIIDILAGVPGVARDEKLRKQIFEITWRDKGWLG